MPKIVKIAEYSKKEVFTPLTLSQVVQTFFFPWLLVYWFAIKQMKKGAMSHLGHRHRQPPQYELGHVHHLLLLKSETAKQLLSYKYIAV